MFKVSFGSGRPPRFVKRPPAKGATIMDMGSAYGGCARYAAKTFGVKVRARQRAGPAGCEAAPLSESTYPPYINHRFMAYYLRGRAFLHLRQRTRCLAHSQVSCVDLSAKESTV